MMIRRIDDVQFALNEYTQVQSGIGNNSVEDDDTVQQVTTKENLLSVAVDEKGLQDDVYDSDNVVGPVDTLRVAVEAEDYN